jgi:hypothetical protein
VCEAELRTAGEPVALRMTPTVGPGGMRADGSDVALVDVEVLDADGRRCPTAFNMIDFELSGPGEWRGGIAHGPDNCILAKRLPVELGVNRVIVRSTSEAGTIRLVAKSQGLKAASVEITSSPLKVVDGLRSTRPGDGLPSRLDRGPTPAGDSIGLPARVAMKIAGVSAGADAQHAAATTDDNEESGWANDGALKTAWIRYELESPATIREVTLRPGSWRTRSYPIRILVDDHEAFVGATPRSLGYVTIPLATPTTGKSLTIQLIGESKDRDDFDITEITGMKLAAGTDGAKDSKGTLRLMEVEIYATPK